MKFLFAPCLMVCLLSAFACKQAAPAPAAESRKDDSSPVENKQLPDIQTLKDNHKILLVRVEGDLSAVSASTKSKLEELKLSFNKAFDEYSGLTIQQAELLETLNTLQSNQGEAAKSLPAWEQASKALATTNEAALQAEENYMELARQFSEMIQTVKKERGF